MRGNSIAELVKETRLMVHGLEAHQDDGGTPGVDDAFIAKLKGLADRAELVDQEQESLKAREKEKTEELEKVLVDMDREYSKARKLAKIGHPQSSWKEFGIQDRQ